jgi:predicted enzyme related to lactoylglutathione lyase
MNNIVYFEIQATEPTKLANFYHEVFGWKFTKQPVEHIEYWHIDTEGMRGGLLKRPAKTPPPEHGTNAFTCSMEVENFDVTANKIMQLGGQVALPKFAVPGTCWQGYFIDIDGNTFGIFQVDANAK